LVIYSITLKPFWHSTLQNVLSKLSSSVHEVISLLVAFPYYMFNEKCFKYIIFDFTFPMTSGWRYRVRFVCRCVSLFTWIEILVFSNMQIKV